jgi:release factor glutamine methyltransferase
MTIAEHVAVARRTLEAAGVPAPEATLDAELLARTALGCDRAALVTRRRETADPAFAAAYAPLVTRRAAREPVGYILGEREFWGLSFEVTRDVLIPRPETELIVEEALAAFGGGVPPATVIDVGTGSGCLAVTLAREFGGADVVATDVSAAALDVARRNALRHGVAGRIDFRNADLLDGLTGRADLIVSNPPYVARRDATALPPEVREHEPHAALFGGDDGLDVYRRLLPAAHARLTRGGMLVLELGQHQADPVIELADAAGLRLEHTRQDLQGITRTVVFGLEA